VSEGRAGRVRRPCGAGLLADDRQGVLDLGLTPMAAKAVMVAPPGPAGLFADPGSASPGRVMVPRSRLLKTSSGVLYEALAGVYTSLGFDVVGNDSFRDLVIARIVEPTSLLDIDRVLAGMGRRAVSLSTRKRTLRRCHQGSYRGQVAAACFEHAWTAGDVSLVLYDVTTLYFEAEKEDDLPTTSPPGEPRTCSASRSFASRSVRHKAAAGVAAITSHRGQPPTTTPMRPRSSMDPAPHEVDRCRFPFLYSRLACPAWPAR